MDLNVQRTGETAVVETGPELNLFKADEFRSVLTGLASDGVHEMILDCERLVQVDSSGLGALIFTRRDLEERGCRISLASVPERMQDLLRLSGLLDYFPMVPETEARRIKLADGN